jgi:excisionase family DNA binding protein
MAQVRLGKTLCRARESDPMDAAITKKRQKKQEPLERFYSVQELAEMLRVHERTIYRWIAGGRLRAYRAGAKWRVSEIDLKAFLEPSDE